jgi:hypothetical protein
MAWIVQVPHPSPPQAPMAGPLSRRRRLGTLGRDLHQPEGRRGDPQAGSTEGSARRSTTCRWYRRSGARRPRCSVTMSPRCGGPPGRPSIPTRRTTSAAHREADFARLWQRFLRRAGRRPDRRLEGPAGRRRPTAIDREHLPEPAWLHPQRRSRQRLPPLLPLMRKSRAGRVVAAKNMPVRPREVWITRGQLLELLGGRARLLRSPTPSR